MALMAIDSRPACGIDVKQSANIVAGMSQVACRSISEPSVWQGISSPHFFSCCRHGRETRKWRYQRVRYT
jgi:hypothetical protein